MAYRHYMRRGLGVDVMTTTIDGQPAVPGDSGGLAPMAPSSPPMAPMPGPTDLMPVSQPMSDPNKVDTTLTPMVPSTALTPMPAATNSSKFISADGVLGIPWKWIIIGGILVAVAKVGGAAGGAAGSIVANFGRKKRRRHSRRRHSGRR